MSHRNPATGTGTGEPPVLTDVAVPGDVAHAKGLHLAARESTELVERPTPADAERYLADRLRDAVRETLSEAMVSAARGTGRHKGSQPTKRRKP
jgi:hypothetical protein